MRLIDVDALLKDNVEKLAYDPVKYTYEYGFVVMVEDILKAPTVDVAEVPRWIPVTERLPEANEKDENDFVKAYLVQDARWMDVACWNGEYWVAWGYGTVLKDVTAWMSLPKPYRKETEDAEVH